MNNRLRIINVAILAAAMAGVTATQAQNVWTGASDDSYNTAGNWSKGSVPDTDATTNAYIVITDTSVNGTINYGDGETNTVRSTEWYGGMTLNQTGGFYDSNRSGNGVRDWVGRSSTPATTFNLTGGTYKSQHILRVGIGGEGAVNIDGGFLHISRGGDGSFGNGTTVSLSMGQTTPGTLSITNGTILTRVGVELGDTATFSVHGAGSTIDIGDNGSNGTWFQNSNAVFRVGVSTNGVSPIVLHGSGQTKFKGGAVLDVGFVDGAMEVGSWPVMVNTNGTWSNLGMVPAAGVDTNDWGFVVSNNVMYVGYGLGWPFGEEVTGPPPSQRTLYWTGSAGDTDAGNSTNWVLDIAATQLATWGPYDNDIWRIADSSVTGIDLGTDYVVDFEDGDAINTAQRDLEIGIGAQGTLNMNSGNLTFTSHSGGRQDIGLNINGDGTINMNADNLTLNAARFGVSGGQGTLNLNGGTFTVERGYGDISLWLGHGGSSTGTVNAVGGRMFTRGPAKLGDGALAIGIFNVEGSVATEIGIGTRSTLDGGWEQNSGSILKCRVDAGGLTTIVIDDNNDAKVDGVWMNLAVPTVSFADGSILDIDFIDGYTGGNGTWDVMTWVGDLVMSDLAFAAGVDTDTWSFGFVDANADMTNDTLRVYASGFGPVVQPDITEYSESNSTVNLAWNSELGISYNVLSSTDLVNGNWSTNVAAVPGAGDTTSTNLTAVGTTEFYQIEAYEE